MDHHGFRCAVCGEVIYVYHRDFEDDPRDMNSALYKRCSYCGRPAHLFQCIALRGYDSAGKYVRICRDCHEGDE